MAPAAQTDPPQAALPEANAPWQLGRAVLIVAALWLVSSQAYYALVTALGLEGGYDAAPVLFATYYLAWAAVAIWLFRALIADNLGHTTVAREGLVVLQDLDRLVPLSDSLRKDVGIVFPQLSSLAKKIMVEKPFEDEIGFFEHYLSRFPETHVTELYKLDPDDEDIENAANLARRSSVTLFFCFDAHLHPNQQQLLAMLQRHARKLIVVLMRDPYSKTFLRPKDTGLSIFGWRQCQIEAAIDKIYGIA